MTANVYEKPEVLLGDLRGGLCSSGLCKQLRSVAAEEIERLQDRVATQKGVIDNQIEEARKNRAHIYYLNCPHCNRVGTVRSNLPFTLREWQCKCGQTVRYRDQDTSTGARNDR